jgi:hypothetical protein
MRMRENIDDNNTIHIGMDDDYWREGSERTNEGGRDGESEKKGRKRVKVEV